MKVDSERIIFRNRASAVLHDFLKIKKGKGIFLLPANICPIVPMVFLKLNIKFELVDIENITYSIDLVEVKNKIEKSPNKYAGLLFVNSYGASVKIGMQLKNLKNLNKNFILIHDKCLSYPEYNAEYDIVDLTLFSTGYGKVVNINYGGYGIIHKKNNDIDRLCNINLSYKEVYLKELEFNYKKSLNTKNIFIYKDSNWLDLRKPKITFKDYTLEIEKKIEKIKNHKNKLNRFYDENINKEFQRGISNLWRYNIIVSNPDKVIAKIFQKGLFASQHYSSLTSIFKNETAINAENLEKKVINIFNDLNVDESYSIEIIKIINKYAINNKNR
jgi:hypothetical protein